MWLNSVRRMTVNKDATALDCVIFGTGGKALVLIPGLSLQQVKSAAFSLAYLYRCFAKQYTVYVVDKKAAVPDGYTIQDMADDVAFLMERLHVGTADVFGISQGGMIAQYLAIGHPRLVHKLVLGVTASRPNGAMEQVLDRWVEMARRREYGPFVIDMFETMYSPAYLKKYRWLFPVLSRVGKPKDFSRFIALAQACRTCNSYPELSKITCPVFVIGGKQDLVVTGGASEEIAAALGCQIYMYGGLGHAAYQEAPDFNRRVQQFLNESCSCP